MIKNKFDGPVIHTDINRKENVKLIVEKKMHISVFLLIIYTSKCLQAKVPPIACNAAHCNPNYEPYSNIFAAMTGYNILTGNPFSSSHSHSDPGFGTGYIFVPTIKTSENTYTLHGGVVVRGLTTCSLSTKANIMTTVSDYAKNVASKVSQGTTFTSNLEYEVSAEIKGVSVSTKIPPLVDAAFTSSEEFKNNEHFFSEKKGVLTLQDATCSSYTVAISHSDPPPFSQTFVNALTDLNNAEESNYQAALDDFIGEFGTHFLYKMLFGIILRNATVQMPRLFLPLKHGFDSQNIVMEEGGEETLSVKIIIMILSDKDIVYNL